MGRLTKIKGDRIKVSTPASEHRSKDRTFSHKNKRTKKQEADKGRGSFQDHLHALGGNGKDVELSKGRQDEISVQGGGSEDPALSKDVSKFLSGLGLNASQHKMSLENHDRKRKLNFGAPKKVKSHEKMKYAQKANGEKAKDGRNSETGKQTGLEMKQNRLQRKSNPSESRASPGRPSVIPPPISPLASAKNDKMLFPPTADWYNLIPPLPASTSPVQAPSATQIASMTTTASGLHAAELSHFSSAPNSALVSSSSEQAFLKNILASGTLSDRLSALTLMVQSSPLHNTRALEVLKGMVEKGRGNGRQNEGDKGKGKGPGGGRDERLKAARAIVDWWVGGGAPKRKLKWAFPSVNTRYSQADLRYLRDQSFLHPEVTKRHLLVWYFEDWLKKYFFSFLQILEALSLDTLPYVRMQVLSFIFTLLRECPEQEHNLLRLMVNKLGDTEKSVCSRASHYLLRLLQAFPDMKAIVVRETTALVMRPAALTVAGASSLTQSAVPRPNTHIKFVDDGDNKDKGKGKKLEAPRPPSRSIWNVHARYYAAITFNQIVLSSSPSDRAAARALMDVYFQIFRDVVGERSQPNEEDDDKMEKIQLTGKGINKGRDAFNGPESKKKGRTVREIQGAAGFAEVQDENSRLVSAILTGVNRAMPFAKFDGGDVEFERHMDTLFLISHTSTFNITLQALTLIHHIVASLPTASSSGKPATAVPARYYRTLYATLLDPRLFTSNKQAMYLNLLYKSLKSDPDTDRVKAFLKRFLQVLVGGFGGNEFVAGGLWLLGELFKNVTALQLTLSRLPKEAKSESDAYDPRKRDPQHARASSSPLWELTPLLHHAHPTVSLLARQLLIRQPLTSSPDLSLHTLMHFLDRFVYKNPKKLKPKGSSAMQPVSASEGDGVRKLKGDLQEKPVNEESWWKRSEANVPVDQLFFHRYFSQRHEKEKAKAEKVGKRKGKTDASAPDSEADFDDNDIPGDLGTDDSDAEEAEIWKAMKASMPVVEGDDLLSDVDDEPNLPSDPGDDSEEDGASADGSVGDYEESVDEDTDHNDQAKSTQRHNVEDEEGFSLAEDSDADDLVNLDTDNSDGLIEWDGSDSSHDDFNGIDEGPVRTSKKRKHDEERTKRKKLRSLPTFASYDDYAKLIEDAPEDDI
ncbi:CBF-domain-containing protein [Vararia minispora EC-137]|uniref:CBF-domain-containing protein n=1 Tax=Vararia minispora EC-137 TaxID=1314806 RepID=A0ACB8QHD9_9AGAM|nr:CBF-domain-containing protein [Vararia minispora EC-137]